MRYFKKYDLIFIQLKGFVDYKKYINVFILNYKSYIIKKTLEYIFDASL